MEKSENLCKQWSQMRIRSFRWQEDRATQLIYRKWSLFGGSEGWRCCGWWASACQTCQTLSPLQKRNPDTANVPGLNPECLSPVTVSYERVVNKLHGFMTTQDNEKISINNCFRSVIKDKVPLIDSLLGLHGPLWPRWTTTRCCQMFVSLYRHRLVL